MIFINESIKYMIFKGDSSRTHYSTSVLIMMYHDDGDDDAEDKHQSLNTFFDIRALTLIRKYDYMWDYIVPVIQIQWENKHTH